MKKQIFFCSLFMWIIMSCSVCFAGEKVSVNKPSLYSDNSVYNMEYQEPDLKNFVPEIMNIENNIQKDIGEYEIVISLKDKENYEWADKTSGDVTLTWKIEKCKVKIPMQRKSYFYI